MKIEELAKSIAKGFRGVVGALEDVRASLDNQAAAIVESTDSINGALERRRLDLEDHELRLKNLERGNGHQRQ